MADFFTDAELVELKKIPDGLEVIPNELRGHYFILAIEQVGMVTVTLTRLILQSMRPVPGDISPEAGGCAAGLQRATHYVRGLRAIKGYTPPMPVPKAQEELVLTPDMKVEKSQ
jgi:hypothetical protein